MFSLPKNTNERYNLIASVLQSHNFNRSKTADALGISLNCVKAVVKWIDEGRPEKTQPGRPQLLTNEIKYFICAKTIMFPETSGAEMANEILQFFGVQASDDTINNCRHKYAFKYGSRVRCLPLLPHHKQNRYIFSQWFLTNRINHRRILFSDESWFELGSLNHYVWRVEGEVYPSVIKTDAVHPPKVMIWGAIGYNFRSNLVVFTKSVNSDVYISQAIIGSNLKATADYVYGNRGWIFQQDNARPHTAKNTIAKLNQIGIQLLPSWPAHSPDLSPIEIVWAIMGRRVEKYRPKNIDQLSQILFFVWNNLSFATINSLIDSFPKKLKKCLEVQGNQVRF